MFEKLKEKARVAKNWVVEHKSEIIVGTLAATAGAVGAALIDRHNRYEDDLFLSIIDKQKVMNRSGISDLILAGDDADHAYVTRGTIGAPTVEHVGERLISKFNDSKDETVIKAIVYTKNSEV